MDDLTVYNFSKDLLECIRVALEDAELPAPCRVCVVPGEIAWDDCQAGQLVVTTVNEYPSSVFPQEAAERGRGTNSSCAIPLLVAEFLFSLTRCAPIPRGLSTSVPCTELDESAQLMRRDAYWMRKALTCCLRELEQDNLSGVNNFLIGRTTSVGPDGGCVGSEITVFLGLDN